jgi:hypothetical protein
MLRRGRLRSKSQEGEETPHNRVSLLLTPQTGIYIDAAEHFAENRGSLTQPRHSPHPQLGLTAPSTPGVGAPVQASGPMPLQLQLAADIRRLLVEALLADLKAYPTRPRTCPDGVPTVASATVREDVQACPPAIAEADQRPRR